MSAARRALHGAGLSPETWRACGVLTGNMLAGWTFTEPELRALHDEGPGAVSPYLATAWFPAAPQGQITIHLGLHGFAKTITTDRCAGLQAIGMAFERVRRRRDELILAGGVEAPRTPLVELAANGSRVRWAPLSEGAAYLVLGAAAGAGPWIAGSFQRKVTTDGGPARALELVLDALETLGRGCPPLGALLVDAPGGCGLERVAEAWAKDGRAGADVEVLFTANLFGEALAASGALSVETARAWLCTRAEPASAVVVSVGESTVELLWLIHEPSNPSRRDAK